MRNSIVSALKSFGLKTVMALSVMALIAAASDQSMAQTVPVEVEGRISSITDNGDGTGSLVVMSINIQIPLLTPISSPTASLTMDQLADPTNLPGRPEYGFIGGTAIVLGNSVDGVVTAADVFVEPAENVVLGEVTSVVSPAVWNADVSTPDCDIYLQNIPLIFLTDPRISFGGAIDGSGIEILPCTIPAGAMAGAEGYYSNGGLYIFVLESDQGEPVEANSVGIARAQCRNSNGRIEVRGGSSDSGAVELTFDDAGNPASFTQETVADLETGENLFRFRVNSSACPFVVTVTHLGNGAAASADVNIR